MARKRTATSTKLRSDTRRRPRVAGAASKSRGSRAKTTRARRPPNPKRRTKTPLFHGGSFFTGMLVGIAATIVGVLLPNWWEAASTDITDAGQNPDNAQPVATEFVFWDDLPRNRSRNRPGNTNQAYRPSTPPDSGAATEFLVQAGSFEQSADADRLRASLLLLGFDARTREVTLNSGATWHRVLVGPFDEERDTRRAMTRLREQKNIEPLLLKRLVNG